MKDEDLPKIISIFPLSNFIIFPNTTVPLNIFEPRYIEMIKDSMMSNKMIGLIQPKKSRVDSITDLFEVGCLGRVESLKDTSDGRFLIDLNGISRFKIVKEIKPKLILGKNINQVFVMGYFGNLDLAFVAKSDVIIKNNEQKGQAWDIAQELYSPIKQDAIMLISGMKKKGVKDFLNFLTSDYIKNKIRNLGYIVD